MSDMVKPWAIGTLNQQRNLLSRAVTLRSLLFMVMNV